MVAARAEVLAAGHLDLLTRALTDAIGALDPIPPGLVVDVGAGPGHHLATVLDLIPDRLGLALDSSAAAARRAARAHARMAAAVCDAWRALPVRDGRAGLLLNVFAPRNGAEFRRVLHPDGRLLVLTPEPSHLTELVAALGLLSVDPDKPRRLAVSLGRWFGLAHSQVYAASLRLDRRAVANLVAMGPSAWHTDPAGMAVRIAGLPEPVAVTAAVRLRVYHPVD
jgi:23S rRNA (guanine745-N1)-methyltransferase